MEEKKQEEEESDFPGTLVRGFIQVGEHRSNKAHPPSAQRVHLSN